MNGTRQQGLKAVECMGKMLMIESMLYLVNNLFPHQNEGTLYTFDILDSLKKKSILHSFSFIIQV